MSVSHVLLWQSTAEPRADQWLLPASLSEPLAGDTKTLWPQDTPWLAPGRFGRAKL